MPEQEGIVDFTGARLIAAGIVGKLDMGNAREMLLQASRDVAFHYLHVVDVVLNEEIAGADVADELGCLLRPAQEKARNVRCIDRLDQQADPLAFQRVRGKPQVRHQHLVQLEHLRIGWCDPDQTIELPAIKRLGVIDSVHHAVAKFVDTIRQNGDAALAGHPIAGR